MKEPKQDCFAYSKISDVESCRALNELYCKKEECRFYKVKKSKKEATCNGTCGKKKS